MGLNKTDLAYAAGIMDGEGCISIYKNRVMTKVSSYFVNVSMANCNEWIVNWFHFAFGGYFGKYATGDNRKPLFLWHIKNEPALNFLKLIYPYLRIKRPQAEIAIKFLKVRRGRGKRLTDEERAVAEAQRIVMAGFNQRGITKKQEEKNGA